jgi:hypothetical protein
MGTYHVIDCLQPKPAGMEAPRMALTDEEKEQQSIDRVLNALSHL